VLGGLIGSGGPSVVALAGLTEKGLSPGAALIGALLSSALGVASLVGLQRQLGRRAVLPALVWLVCLTAALGIGVNQVAPVPRPLHLPARVEELCALLLFAAILLRAERVGVRRWLAGWFVEPDQHGHEHHHHAHDQAHPHGQAGAHSSETPNGNAATTRSPDASGPSADA
jgi:hypothetical protein